MTSIVRVPLPARVVHACMDDGAGVRAKDRIVERSIARYGSPPLRPCILSVYHALTLRWRCDTWHDEQIDDLEQSVEDLAGEQRRGSTQRRRH